MSTGVIVEPFAYPSDDRGFVIEPVGPDDLPAQRNIHVVVTLPGAIRGNHYHEHGDEITVAVGPLQARFLDGGRIRDVVLADGEAARFRIARGVPHAFRNTGNRPILIVGCNTRPHDPTRPDAVRHVLIDPQPETKSLAENEA